MSASPSLASAATAVVENKQTTESTLCEEPTQDKIENESLLAPILQKVMDKKAAKAQRCREYRARMALTTGYRAAERERKRLARQRKKAEAEALLMRVRGIQASSPEETQRLAQKLLMKYDKIRTPYSKAVERERKRLYRARKKADAQAWSSMDVVEDMEEDLFTLSDNVSPTDFDPSLSEDERRFYVKAYPNIEMVRDRKVHCTICKMHIGTAPSQESIIKMHPVLRVTHCTKCHDFYNSGEFSKGEDGSELYCRWCGQGGEVYCCSNCPYVFCKSCIVKNLSRGVVADIEQNENWSCFNCAPKILWPLRAQHWALIKYIDKQKKAIENMNLPEADMKLQMNTDRSTCCRLSKTKLGSMSDSLESIDSLSRRSREGSVSKKNFKSSPSGHSPAAKRQKTNNDEVVCTPDLLSMLEPDCQITVSSKPRPSQSPLATSPKVMSIQNPNVYGGGSSMQNPMNKNPPPLVLRNTSVQVRPITSTPIVRRTVIGPRTPTPGGNVPVYHTINGYRIDLNSAAQQETFRLPNGKLIQVKRQGSSQTATQASPTSSLPNPAQQANAWQRQIQQSRPVQISPMHSNPQQHYPQITIQQHAPQQHPQMIRYQNTMVGNTTVTAVHNGAPAQIQVINGQQAPTAAAAPPQTAAAVPQLIRLVRHVFPDTAIGQARTQLQDQVFNAMEICQHLTGKVQTLTNSNAYKQARNYLEVKELYIHLSYLLTYAIGRFKGLQDKCLGDMRQLGFVNDADSLENGQLAAGVDYVRYGQLDDVELFNTGCNSFHNQVYEYRKSLHANLENDQAAGGGGDEERPLSPLIPLGTCFIDADDEKADSDDEQLKKTTVPKVEVPDVGEESQQSGNGQDDDIDDDNEVDETMHHAHNIDGDDDEAESLFTPITSMYEDENPAEYSGAGYDGMDNYEDDFDMTRPGGSGRGGEAVIRRENESHANDRKLTRLIEKYPSIWCTRHPDYGNFEITRKQWNRIAAHFNNDENIKLRWKNIRKRFVRIEERLKIGKRFNGYYDRSINFLFNRALPEHEWMPVDRGDHFGAGFGRQSPPARNDYGINEQLNNDFADETENIGPESNFRNCPVRVIDIRPTDMKIINFVKCNPVLWRKSTSTDPVSNKMDERTRKSLWMHLWKQLPAMSCEELMDRWAYLYEMYKTFRLKHIKDENVLANMEVKYSKYLATLHFLYKIDEEDLKKENLTMQDCGNLDELPENDLNLQDMPDDREFVFALVAAVKPCINLWHHRHLDYNDNTRRERMWQEIEEKLKDFKHKQASDDEDNEIEIVEPKTDTITLIDSDNEDDSPTKSPAKNNPNQTTSQIQTPTNNNSSAESVTLSNGAIDDSMEIDFMASAQSFLASMLEVDLNEGDQPYTVPSPSSDAAAQKKQPRKKTTNKPNPTLLKKKEMLERERLEEMKRNDMKLKMKCTIELKKAEEEFPFAKSMLDEKEIADAENKKEEDCEEVEVLLVDDLDSSAEEEKLKLADDVEKRDNEGEIKEKDKNEVKDENKEKDETEEKDKAKEKNQVKEKLENKEDDKNKDKDENKEKVENKEANIREDDHDEVVKVSEVNEKVVEIEKKDLVNDSAKVNEAGETKGEIETAHVNEEKQAEDVKDSEDSEKKQKDNDVKNGDTVENSKNVSTVMVEGKDTIQEEKQLNNDIIEQNSNSSPKKNTVEQNDKNEETTSTNDEKEEVEDVEMIELNETEASAMDNEKTVEEKKENVTIESSETNDKEQDIEMVETANGELDSPQKVEPPTKVNAKEILDIEEKIETISSKSEKQLIETQAQEDTTNNVENEVDKTAIVSETSAASVNGEDEIDVDKEIEKLLQKERNEKKCDDNVNIEATTTEKSKALEKLESTAPATSEATAAASEDLMNDITELIESATNTMT